MVVTAAVDPGTNSDTIPSSIPEDSITRRTPSVRSTTSASPWVEKRSCPLWTVRG